MSAAKSPMPQDLEAEMSLLGSLLLDREAVGLILPIIGRDGAEMFYRSDHGILYNALVDLYERNDPIDLIVLEDELRRREQLNTVGDRAYLIDLHESVPSAANAEYYARIVRDKWRLRTLVNVGHHLRAEALDPAADADELVRRIEMKLMAEAGQVRQAETLTAADSRRIVGGILAGRVEAGLDLGFPEIDQKLMGLRPGQVHIVAARPAVGKSSLAAQAALNVVKRQQVPVGFLTLEMSGASLLRRIISQQLRIPGWKLKRYPQRITDVERAALERFELPAGLHIVEGRDMTIADCRNEARRLKMQHGIGMLVVDYLGQLRDPDSGKQGRVVEVGMISRGLSVIARELEIPLLVMHSVSRAAQHDQREPELHDLRDSGQIDHDAHSVMMLFTKTKWAVDQRPPEVLEVKCKIVKNRDGDVGRITLNFERQFARFESGSPGPESGDDEMPPLLIDTAPVIVVGAAADDGEEAPY